MKSDLQYIPHYHYKRIEDISIEDILSWGVQGIVIDIDNTICFDATKKFIGESKMWIEKVKKADIPIGILSNANPKRAMKIGKMLGLPCIALAKKPVRAGYDKISEIIGVSSEKTAYIGDQIFSDVVGANRVGGISVLVEPPSKEIVFFFFYRIRRIREKPYVKKMLLLEEKNDVPHLVRERDNQNETC